MLRPLLVALCLLGPGLLPSPARGQQALGIEQGPTRSVYQPGTGVADGPEPWSVVHNPGALGELRGLTIGLRDTETASDTPWTGRGTGLYLAAPVPYLGRLQLSGALELLRPPSQVPVGTSGKLTLGLSLRVFSSLSIGLSYARLFAPSSPLYDGLNTLSLGTRLRTGRWFAAGLVLHDATSPRGSDPAAAPLQRVYELELLGRPLGDERLEMGAGSRFGELRGDIEPRLRLWVRPTAGLGLGGEATLLFDPNGPNGPQGGGPAFRVALGLQLDFAHLGGSAFGFFGQAPGGEVGLGGASIGLRASLERYPSLWHGGAHLYRIEPGKLEGLGFLQMIGFLRQIETERSARGVVLILGDLKVGWGRAEELREALLRLRRAGRHVYVYGAELNTRGYYVATAAERIFLDPMGAVRVPGVAVTTWYVKEALDLLGVRADLLRIGAYKATPETFTRGGPTPEARAEREAVVEETYHRLLLAMQTGRRLPPDRAAALVERGLFTPPAAYHEGLVDSVATGAEVEEFLRRELGQAVDIVAQPDGPTRQRSWSRPAIAVVNIEGDLVDGESRTIPILDLKLLGGETTLQEIEQVARDPRVQAIVLRVESPGGSVLAADLLARLVAQVRRVKPVVCSFGDVAASGGYYLAAPCAAIFTSATTVTGSIGIFGGKVDASEIAGRLGVRALSLQRGQHADMDQFFRPYTDAERALVMEQLRYGYERFLTVVGAGRRLSKEVVDGLGQGRIWTGAQAVDKKLCDRVGGLFDAVDEARRLARLGEDEDIEIAYYPRPAPGLFQRLLGLLPFPVPGVQARLPLVGRLTGVVFQLTAALLLLDSPVLARLEGGVPR